MARKRHPNSAYNNRHKLKPGEREKFCAIFVLNQMINNRVVFPLNLVDSNAFLIPLFKWMQERNLIDSQNVVIRKKTVFKSELAEWRYVPSTEGREFLTRFLQRYQEFIKLYDIPGAVDLTEGTFAFERYFELSSDDFKTYLAQDNWEDLRVAVAEFKNLDPIEIVFMSFLNENKINANDPNWPSILVSDALWEEILRICNTNLSWRELGYRSISAEKVITDIITKSVELMFRLHAQEDDMNRQLAETSSAEVTETVTEEVVEEVVVETIVIDPFPIDYYTPYYNPFYVSPVWVAPLLLF